MASDTSDANWTLAMSAPSFQKIATDAALFAYGYVVYLPEGYAQKASWPVLIYLHGNGSCGGGSDATLQTHILDKPTPIGSMVVTGARLPFVVLAPQTPCVAGQRDFSDSAWTTAAQLPRWFNYIFTTSGLKLDPKRIYGAGSSYGASGAYNMAYWLSGQAVAGDGYGTPLITQRVAAVMPVSPGTPTPGGANIPIRANRIVTGGVSLWNMHAIDDSNGTTLVSDRSRPYFRELAARQGADAGYASADERLRSG